MADYDGVVWTVADPEENETGTVFTPVDTQLPELDDPCPTTPTSCATESRSSTSAEPSCRCRAPPPSSTFADERDPRLNLQTGTVALPGGVTDGPTYEVTAAAEPRATEAQLADSTVPPVDRTEELKLLQPPVRNLAADLVEGATGGTRWRRSATSSSAAASTTPPATRRPATPKPASPPCSRTPSRSSATRSSTPPRRR